MKKRLVALIVALGLVSSVLADDKPQSAKDTKGYSFFYTTEGKVLKAKEITKLEANGDVWYSRGKGQLKMKKKDYIYFWVPMPKDLKSAKTTTDYRKAYDKYKEFGWNVYCILKEAELLQKAGKKEAALTRIELIKGYELINPIKRGDLVLSNKLLANLYIENGKLSEATEILTEVAKADDAKTAAFALNKKGDILVQKQEMKDAILSYLQTVILYKGQVGIDEERAEALCKAHNAMKNIKDGGRATTFSKQLKLEYPESLWIKKLTN